MKVMVIIKVIRIISTETAIMIGTETTSMIISNENNNNDVK